jgi:hypothetical protein
MSRINTYEELVTERKKIEANIAASKLILHEGIRDLKEKLEPFLYLLPVLNIIKKKETNNTFLKFIAALGIDVFVGQRLLSKSSWLSRLVIPMVLKAATALAIGNAKTTKRIVHAEQEA